jgi:hypothetical protein
VCVCVHVCVHVALYVCVRVAVSVLWLCLCDEGVSVQRVSVYLGMSARLRGRDCVLLFVAVSICFSAPATSLRFRTGGGTGHNRVLKNRRNDLSSMFSMPQMRTGIARWILFAVSICFCAPATSWQPSCFLGPLRESCASCAWC